MVRSTVALRKGVLGARKELERVDRARFGDEFREAPVDREGGVVRVEERCRRRRRRETERCDEAVFGGSEGEREQRREVLRARETCVVSCERRERGVSSEPAGSFPESSGRYENRLTSKTGFEDGGPELRPFLFAGPVARKIPRLSDATFPFWRAEGLDNVLRLADRVQFEVETGEAVIVEDECGAVLGWFGHSREDCESTRDKVGRDGGVGEPAYGEVVTARVEGDEGADGEPEREREQELGLGIVVRGCFLRVGVGVQGECEVVQARLCDERRRLIGRSEGVEVRDEALEVRLARGRVELHEISSCEGEQVVDRERAVRLNEAMLEDGSADLGSWDHERLLRGCCGRLHEHERLGARLHVLGRPVSVY